MPAGARRAAESERAESPTGTLARARWGELVDCHCRVGRRALTRRFLCTDSQLTCRPRIPGGPGRGKAPASDRAQAGAGTPAARARPARGGLTGNWLVLRGASRGRPEAAAAIGPGPARTGGPDLIIKLAAEQLGNLDWPAVTGRP
jgi:hypothetical protein